MNFHIHRREGYSFIPPCKKKYDCRRILHIVKLFWDYIRQYKVQLRW